MPFLPAPPPAAPPYVPPAICRGFDESYCGPGDIAPGAFVFSGMRPYNRKQAETKSGFDPATCRWSFSQSLAEAEAEQKRGPTPDCVRPDKP